MRYRGLQLCIMLLATAACARAQATPAPAPSRDAAERERAAAERQRELSRELAEVVRERTEAARQQAGVARERAQAMVRGMTSDSALMNRATLGVTLAPTGNRRDTLGIFISAVAPDGPAERAGIFEGDRIAAINGVDVRTQASDAGDPYLAGVAQRRLTLELRKLTPGQRVSLRVWSGGRYKDVQVTTARYTEVYRRGAAVRIGTGSFAPAAVPRIQVVPDIHVAPLTPRRIIMPAPRVQPLPRGGRVEMDDLAGALVASFDFPEPSVASVGLEPLAEVRAMFEVPVVGEPLDDALDVMLEDAAEDELPPMDVETSTREAIRQARETLSGLETEVTLN